MAKKAELLEQAKKLKLDVSANNTVAEIEAVLEQNKKSADSETKAVKTALSEETGEVESTETDEPKLAKAGKRSAKAVAEAEEKAEKEERKAAIKDGEEAPKITKPVQITRTRLERSGKKLRESSKLIEKGKEYTVKEALDLATKTSQTKFDATVELHVRLRVDPKHADQNIRENIILPAGTGKDIRVAVFGEADDVTVAKKAGANIAAADEFLQQLDKGTINFDVLVATPAVMPKLGKYARLLGPKGLMPNPKSGTVTKDVAKAVEQAKAGKVEARVDETGIVHLGIGKVSFGVDKLNQNAQAVFSALKAAKPASVKGTYVVSIFVTSSMGPSIRVAANEL